MSSSQPASSCSASKHPCLRVGEGGLHLLGTEPPSCPNGLRTPRAQGHTDVPAGLRPPDLGSSRGRRASRPPDIHSGFYTTDVLAGPLQTLPSRRLKSFCL